MQRPTAAGRWLDRNAKWFVPLVIVAFIGLGAAGLYGFLRWFDGYMRSLPPYRMALQELRSNRDAALFLGPPVEAKGQIQGSFQINNSASNADLTIPVQGAIHKGALHVVATAVGDEWTLETVVLQVRDPQRRFVIVKED